MIKVNDIVRYLNDVGGGRVTRIEGNTIYVEDEDGFERPSTARELVVVQDGGVFGKTAAERARAAQAAYERPLEVRSKLVQPSVPAPKIKPAVEPRPLETAEGNVLNIALAFEPKEIKHLNTTTFFASLVNDSNYYLAVSYSTRADDTSEWTMRYCGVIEPNMLQDLDEFGHADLNNIEHVAVQYIAYKKDRAYKLKNPALVQLKLDTTKFFKLHSFHSTEYFDEPVLQEWITHNDLPAKPVRIDSAALERAMREKRRTDDRPATRLVRKAAGQQKKSDIIVQDLHIAELLDDLAGLSNADMLNYQLAKFREVMDANVSNLGQKIVFIHGKGEGVLRNALVTELKRRYPHCSVQDASFQEYGFGATQVTIHR